VSLHIIDVIVIMSMFTILKLYVCLKMKIKPNNYMTNEESSAKAHEIHHPPKTLGKSIGLSRTIPEPHDLLDSLLLLVF